MRTESAAGGADRETGYETGYQSPFLAKGEQHGKQEAVNGQGHPGGARRGACHRQSRTLNDGAGLCLVARPAGAALWRYRCWMAGQEKSGLLNVLACVNIGGSVHIRGGQP